MYIIGGFSLLQQTSTTADAFYNYVGLDLNDVYDTVRNTWNTYNTSSYPVPAARGRHTTAISPDGATIIIFGGVSYYSSSNHTVYNDVWALDVAKSVWRSVQTTGTQPSARANHNGTNLF